MSATAIESNESLLQKINDIIERDRFQHQIIEELQSTVKKLTKDVNDQSEQIKAHKNIINRLDNKARENNIVITNFTEQPRENYESLMDNVKKIVKHIDPTIQVTKAFRSGKQRDGNTEVQKTKPRPIIASLINEQKRDTILKNAFKLKTFKPTVFITDDICPDWKNERNEQMNEYFEKKKIYKKVYFRGRKLHYHEPKTELNDNYQPTKSKINLTNHPSAPQISHLPQHTSNAQPCLTPPQLPQNSPPLTPAPRSVTPQLLISSPSRTSPPVFHSAYSTPHTSPPPTTNSVPSLPPPCIPLYSTTSPPCTLPHSTTSPPCIPLHSTTSLPCIPLHSTTSPPCIPLHSTTSPPCIPLHSTTSHSTPLIATSNSPSLSSYTEFPELPKPTSPTTPHTSSNRRSLRPRKIPERYIA